MEAKKVWDNIPLVVAFTWVPKPFGHSYLDQQAEHRPVLLRLLRVQKGYACTELTLQGNVHYHGAMVIKNKVSYYKNLKRLKKIGFVLVKCIDNVAIWNEYCFKEQLTVSQLIHDSYISSVEDISIAIAHAFKLRRDQRREKEREMSKFLQGGVPPPLPLH